MEEINLIENIVVLTLNQIGVDVHTCVSFSNTMMAICVPILCFDLLSMIFFYPSPPPFLSLPSALHPSPSPIGELTKHIHYLSSN